MKRRIVIVRYRRVTVTTASNADNIITSEADHDRHRALTELSKKVEGPAVSDNYSNETNEPPQDQVRTLN